MQANIGKRQSSVGNSCKNDAREDLIRPLDLSANIGGLQRNWLIQRKLYREESYYPARIVPRILSAKFKVERYQVPKSSLQIVMKLRD
jgi:hypothetical protein